MKKKDIQQLQFNDAAERSVGVPVDTHVRRHMVRHCVPYALFSTH